MTPSEPPDEGGTWISSGQIYRELRRIGDEVAHLRADLVEVGHLREQTQRHETRLASLERRVWGLAGAAAAAGGVAGIAGQAIGG